MKEKFKEALLAAARKKLEDAERRLRLPYRHERERQERMEARDRALAEVKKLEGRR